MPEEITGKAATEWRCTGHVVRLQPFDNSHGKLGVGVQFDCQEVLRSKADTPFNQRGIGCWSETSRFIPA